MSEIYLSSLNDEQIQIIELIGLDNFVKICEYAGGENIYFPSMRSTKITIRNSNIKKEFNGKNYKFLSQKYHICERHIRRIINSKD